LTDLLTPALALYDVGLCVLPVATDGSKKPGVPSWRQYQHARPTREQIVRWFDTTQHGLGVVCGAISGNLEMLELEGRAVAEGYVTLIAARARLTGLTDLWAKVAHGYRENTPSGGVHLLYHVTGDVAPNTKFARRPSTPDELETYPDQKIQVLIETRGEGGWVVTAPSNGRCHPTGGAWQIAEGNPATIPTVTTDERDALHDLMRSFDQMPRPDPSPTPRTSGMLSDRLSPGDDYNQRATWEQILEPYGWRRIFRHGQTTHWCRPGKTHGTSATTGHSDADCLYVFSTSTEFESETSYTKFGAYALLEHRGDYATAAKALRATGYGQRTDPPKAHSPESAVVDNDPAAQPEGGRSGPEYVDFVDLFATPRQPVVWLASPLIAARRVTLLFSPAKAGKSLIAMECATGIATGMPVLGNPAGDPLHVLYIDQEMTPEDWYDRLTDMGYTAADAHLLNSRLHLAQLQPWPPMDSPIGGLAVLAAAEDTASQVVIIDTASKVVRGEENSNDTHGALYRNTIVPLKRAGCAVLILDHTGKDLERGARGGSAKTDNVDLAFELTTRGNDALSLRCSHARFRDEALQQPAVLRRETDPLRHIVHTVQYHEPADGFEPTGYMERVSRYVEMHPGVGQNTIVTGVGGKRDYVKSAIDLLIHKGYLTTQKGSRNAVQHHSLAKYRDPDATDSGDDE